MKSIIALLSRRQTDFRYILLCTIFFLVPYGYTKDAKTGKKPSNYHTISLDKSPATTVPSDSTLTFRSAHVSDSANSSWSAKKWLAKLASSTQVEKTSKKAGKAPGRNPSIISQLVNKYSEAITKCYHSYLKINPDLHGKLIVRILVESSGRVYDVQTIESDLLDLEFETKVTSIIKSWDQFPPVNSDKIYAYRQEYVFGEE